MSYQQGPQYGYQQQQGYPPQQGGYPPPGFPQPPRKSNTALIVTLAGVAAAAVIALVLVLVLSGKDDSSKSADSGKPDGGAIPGASGGLPGGGKASGGAKPGTGTGSSGGGSGSSGGGAGTARELAETAVSIINSHSTSQISGLTCDSNATKELTSAMGQLPSSATATLVDVRESGSYAAAAIKVLMGSQTKNITLSMSQHGSKWCAAGI
ncbi:hypothetical protein [Actinocrispum wychmicini]|uniref:Uncharacterized protein n=1 Tax=Actinocrispum wychmicini TaxID=1213861 RepID=A0A4R2K188_9PSEU|nr:hypothetical protein [Actinocrispum wychmicini]TCO65422.1 hypothetical protein EV192_1011214 [Actinocrispum wychmicini]